MMITWRILRVLYRSSLIFAGCLSARSLTALKTDLSQKSGTISGEISPLKNALRCESEIFFEIGFSMSHMFEWVSSIIVEIH